MTALDIVQQAAAVAHGMVATTEGRIAVVSAVVAGLLVLGGTFVKTMIPLRLLAVGSNVGFIVYAALAHSLPMLVLHCLLLPINSWRAMEMVKLTQRVRAAARRREGLGIWLRPYMTHSRLETGTVLFRKGDAADHLYMLAHGRIELVEIGVILEPGRVFGEIAFFSPDRRRTLTARCIEPCELLGINEITVRQLYFQNPEFGFELIGLVAARLSEDVARLERAIQAAKAREDGPHEPAPHEVAGR